MKLRNLLIPKTIQKLRNDLKVKGPKRFVMEMGWKVALGIFIFYLVRDSIMYLLIPYLMARGILTGC